MVSRIDVYREYTGWMYSVDKGKAVNIDHIVDVDYHPEVSDIEDAVVAVAWSQGVEITRDDVVTFKHESGFWEDKSDGTDSR